MSHALVVGGTGMLRDVSIALSGRFDALTVIARRAMRLERLRDALDASCVFEPLAVDYEYEAPLIEALDRVQAAHGPIDLAVCWIHEVAPDAPRLVAERIAAAHKAADSMTTPQYMHVVGSAAGDPTQVGDARRDMVEAVAGVGYRQVILGFVLQGEDSRWLTNREIAAGVVSALDTETDPHIIGTVRPWDRRP